MSHKHAIPFTGWVGRRIVHADMNPAIHWEDPAALLRQAKRELAAVDHARLFNSSRYEKLREKWCAAVFGIGYEKNAAPCRVAVNESQQHLDTDFFLETAGAEYPFQLVEAMEPERRRGAEYKAQAKRGSLNFGIDPARGRVEGPDWIANAVKQKAEKNYAGAELLNILVYSNFNAAQLQYRDVANAARLHVSGFASAWVITNMWICSLDVSNGLRSIEGWGLIFKAADYLSGEAG